MHFLNTFFFDIYPYIAGSVFLIGSWLRYDYGQYTWRAASSQMLDRKGMNLASNLFHIGILGIFAGHFLGMLTPHWMYEAWLPLEVKQKMAMFAGGASGVMCLIGGVLLLKRRLFSPRVRATTTGADILILSVGYPVCAGSADHSVLRPAYGRQRDDEAGELGADSGDLPWRSVSVSGWRRIYFPCAPCAGYDAVPVVPILASGTHLERPGRISDTQIPDCSCTSLIVFL